MDTIPDNLPPKVRVKFAIWGITVDKDIAARYAPAAYRALMAGGVDPEVDVTDACKLMKHQQERVNIWPKDLTATEEPALV